MNALSPLSPVAASFPVTFWSMLGSNLIHPLDAPYLQPESVSAGRLPQPWTGPLNRADIFILNGNPGEAGSEVAIEASDGGFREALGRQLRGDAPNVFLGADFAHHPGYAWMRRKLGPDLPLARLASRICTIELFAYAAHDNAYGRAVSDRIPSSIVIQHWVQKELAPRARAGEVALLVMRAARQWGFEPGEQEAGLFVAGLGHARGGYLTRNTPAGRRLRQWLAKTG